MCIKHPEGPTRHRGTDLDLELASTRDEGTPQEGRTRGAVGGIVPIVTTSRLWTDQPNEQGASR
jgi:hypothetical protein